MRQRIAPEDIEIGKKYKKIFVSRQKRWLTRGAFIRYNTARIFCRPQFRKNLLLGRESRLESENLYSQPQKSSGRVFSRHASFNFFAIHRVLRIAAKIRLVLRENPSPIQNFRLRIQILN